MYKKSLKSMPRSIKKELVKSCMFIQSMTDIIPISQSDCASEEEIIVNKLSKIKGLPSYWLVSSKTDPDVFYLVFDSLVTLERERKMVRNIDFFRVDLSNKSYSPYYGIY